MSTNCLVTKLKGTVDNGSLSKLGELKVHIGAYVEGDTVNNLRAQGAKVSVRTTGNYLKQVVNGVISDTATNVITATTNNELIFFIVTQECDIFISEKYKVNYLGLNRASEDINDDYFGYNISGNAINTVVLKNTPNSVKINNKFGAVTVDTGNIIFTGTNYQYLSEIKTNNANRSLEVDFDFIGTNMPNLTRLDTWTNKRSGNVLSLANCSKLNALNGLSGDGQLPIEQFIIQRGVNEANEIWVSWGTYFSWKGVQLTSDLQRFAWRTSSVEGAVMDIQCGPATQNNAIAVDASGNKVADVTPWLE